MSLTVEQRHNQATKTIPRGESISGDESRLADATDVEDAALTADVKTKHPSVTRDDWRTARADILKNGISWPIAMWIGLIHVGALAAPFVFSWQGVVALFVLHWLTGGIGVCLCYHRLLTHRSFKTFRPLRYLLATIGGLAGEGSSLHWVADHRKHHAHSDQVGDPHSPHDGPWWSHIFWTMAKKTRQHEQAHLQRWVPDLMQERALRILHVLFLPLHFALAFALMGLGYWIGGWYMAWSLLVWGMFLRLTLVLHTTWFVNSASHMWGYRNYDTTDDSRNNWWVALIAYGEGWHNNHHAFPTTARHGHRWWEVDVTFLTIRLMRALGLAWDVVEKRPQDKGAATA